MFLSMNWIQDFVDLSGLDKIELIRKFSLSTAEVENDILRKGSEISIETSAKCKSAVVENHQGGLEEIILRWSRSQEVMMKSKN